MTTHIMGPRPAVRGCCCHICVPDFPGNERPPDDSDRRCIDMVLRAGWEVIAVGGPGRCSCCGGLQVASEEAPVFAYTVGLTHRTGCPELAMSGQDVDTMHRVLNYVADAVVAGHRLSPGDSVEGALPNVPLTVDEISGKGLRQIGTWSAWFHRRPVRALQLVCPSVDGLFAWQPGAPTKALNEQQPPSWRVRSKRVGGFAVDPLWPFPVAPDALAVVCTHVRHGGEPVRLVNREPGVLGPEDWMFGCGRDHGEGIEQLMTEHVAHTVRAAPSIRQVADLALGEWAWRDDAFSPWQRCPGRFSEVGALFVGLDVEVSRRWPRTTGPSDPGFAPRPQH